MARKRRRPLSRYPESDLEDQFTSSWTALADQMDDLDQKLDEADRVPNEYGCRMAAQELMRAGWDLGALLALNHIRTYEKDPAERESNQKSLLKRTAAESAAAMRFTNTCLRVEPWPAERVGEQIKQAQADKAADEKLKKKLRERKR